MSYTLSPPVHMHTRRYNNNEPDGVDKNNQSSSNVSFILSIPSTSWFHCLLNRAYTFDVVGCIAQKMHASENSKGI